jgi:hypothetical protein
MTKIYWPYSLLCLPITNIIYLPKSFSELDINYGKEIQRIYFETKGFQLNILLD